MSRPLEALASAAAPCFDHSDAYGERLAESGIEPSVGSTGDSYDNALAESINGLNKADVIHRRGPWRNVEAVEFATLEWSTGSTVDACSNRSETFRQ